MIFINYNDFTIISQFFLLPTIGFLLSEQGTFIFFEKKSSFQRCAAARAKGLAALSPRCATLRSSENAMLRRSRRNSRRQLKRF